MTGTTGDCGKQLGQGNRRYGAGRAAAGLGQPRLPVQLRG